jgi:hypothetical protein
MKRSNLMIAFYLVLIFASGIVVGAFATHLYEARAVIAGAPTPRLTPEEWRRQYTTEMQTRLNLNPDQLTKLNQTMDETRGKVHAEHERHKQEMKSIHDEHMNRVRAMLTEQQRPEYEKLRQEREERSRKNQPPAKP